MRLKLLIALLVGALLWYVLPGTTPAMLVPQAPRIERASKGTAYPL